MQTKKGCKCFHFMQKSQSSTFPLGLLGDCLNRQDQHQKSSPQMALTEPWKKKKKKRIKSEISPDC